MTGYYLRRAFTREPKLLTGLIVTLAAYCEQATLDADPGWVRVPAWAFTLCAPLIGKTFKTLKTY